MSKTLVDQAYALYYYLIVQMPTRTVTSKAYFRWLRRLGKYQAEHGSHWDHTEAAQMGREMVARRLERANQRPDEEAYVKLRVMRPAIVARMEQDVMSSKSVDHLAFKFIDRSDTADLVRLISLAARHIFRVAHAGKSST